MAALMDAARLGISVKGATLFCTTFPCHMCARHIVAAGIERVLYIEPYPKSMAAKLYPDSISVDGKSGTGRAVRFEPFAGVSPMSYVELFEAPQRKDKQGRAVLWKEASARPRLERFAPSHVLTETAVIKALSKTLERMGMRHVQGEEQQ